MDRWDALQVGGTADEGPDKYSGRGSFGETETVENGQQNGEYHEKSTSIDDIRKTEKKRKLKGLNRAQMNAQMVCMMKSQRD